MQMMTGLSLIPVVLGFSLPDHIEVGRFFVAPAVLGLVFGGLVGFLWRSRRVFWGTAVVVTLALILVRIWMIARYGA